MFARGPHITAFQHLPDTLQLRLVFSEATNEPEMSGALVGQLFDFHGQHDLSIADVLDAAWEPGGQALRLLLRANISLQLSAALRPPLANLSVVMKEAGNLRNRNESSFFASGLSPQLQEVRCSPGTTLLAGQENCSGCGQGFFLDVSGGSAAANCNLPKHAAFHTGLACFAVLPAG